MFNKYTEEVQKIILNSNIEKNMLKHEFIGTEHITLAILKQNNNITKILNKFNLDYNKFKNYIINNIGIGKSSSDYILYTPILKKIFAKISTSNEEDININKLFLEIINMDNTTVRILLSFNINIEELYNEINIYKNTENEVNDYPLLKELGINLNEKAKNELIDPVIERDKELNNIIQILNRRYKNNPILIGEAGVGKTAIIEDLANKIVNNKIDSLKDKIIISLDMASIVSGTKYRGEFEEKIKKIISEAENNKNIILFIDEIHTIIGAGGAEGAIDASNIFKPALARGNIKIIGATTKSEYQKFIASDGAIERRFQKVEINEPDMQTTKKILIKIKPLYEKYHNVKISNNLINDIILMSNKYIKNRFEPDKSIDLLDEVLSKVSLKDNSFNKKQKMLKNELINIVKQKKESITKNDYKNAFNLKEKEQFITNEINILELNNKTNKKEVKKSDLINLIKDKLNMPIISLDKKYINYIKSKLNTYNETIINNLISIAKDYSNNKINNYIILFYGEKGTGKTSLANEYSKLLFNENSIIYIDINTIDNINEYFINQTNIKDINMLIIDNINDYNIVYIDNFISNISNGYFKNKNNNKIDINNLLIILIYNKNSNLGFSNNINKNIKKLRYNKLIEFNNLTESEIKKIIIKKLNDKNIKYDINTINQLINESKYMEYNTTNLDNILDKYSFAMTRN